MGDDLSSPYVGLAPFDEAHADYFFGRTLDAEVIVDNVLVRRLTLLYGASGVGKSSVLNVGVPRALRSRRQAARLLIRRDWREPESLGAWLTEVTAAPAGDDGPLLILVLDQFEEYFLYAKQPEVFAAQLAALTDAAGARVHLLFSLRSDSLALLDPLRLQLPGLFDTTLELRHLDRNAVHEAIVRPIEVWNARHDPPVTMDTDFAETLLEQLYAADPRPDKVETAGIELAFLQLTLQRIWTAEGGRSATALRTRTLTDLHGVREIVRAHVEEVLNSLPTASRQVCAQVFDRLVTKSGTKIAYSTADLADTTGLAPQTIDDTLQPLAAGNNRLLRQLEFRTPERGRGYEIVHDVLAAPLFRWTQEQHALERERAHRRVVRRRKIKGAAIACVSVALFVASYTFYLERSRNQSNALANKALASTNADPARAARLALAALERYDRNELAEPALRRAMAMLEIAHTTEIIEPCEAARTAKSVAVSDPGRAGRGGACDPVLDIRYSSDGKLLLVASGKGVWMFDSKTFQQKGARIARDEEVLQTWLINGTLITKTVDGKVQMQHLSEGLVRRLTCPDDARVWPVTSTRDGRLVALGCYAGEVLVWDLEGVTDQPKYRLRRDELTTTALDFSADGTFLASGDSAGKLTVWKLGQDEVWIDHVIDRNKNVLLEHEPGRAHPMENAIRDLHFYESDPSFMVSAGDNRQAIVWKLNLHRTPLTKPEQSEQRQWKLSHERPVTVAKFFPAVEGNTPPVFTLSGKNAQRWVNEDSDAKQIRGHNDSVNDANASPDGSLLVTASADGTARIWSTRQGPPIAVLRGHRGAVNRALFSPEGDAVLTASDDGSVRVWRFRAPELLAASRQWELGATFDHTGLRVAITEESGSICVLTLADHKTCFDFDPDAPERDVKMLWIGHPMEFPSWSADGKFVVGYASPEDLDSDPSSVLWAVGDRNKSDSPALKGASFAVFRAGGDELLTENSERQLALWDAKRLGEPGLVPLIESGPGSSSRGVAAISPDGQWIAAANGKDIELWHRAELRSPPKRLVGFRGWIRSLRFSTDSSQLLGGSDDRTARVWSVASPTADPVLVFEGPHTGSVFDASFDPTGHWVATGSADGTIGVWDAKTAHLLALLRWHGEGVNAVEFSPDGHSILSASDDGTVTLGQCDACMQTLAEVKAQVPRMATLSNDAELELQREIR